MIEGKRAKVLLAASAILLVVAVVTVILWAPISALLVPTPSSHSAGLCTDCGAALGSSGTSFVGWLIPADTQFSTSFVVSQPMKGVNAVFNVFPYQLQDGTTLLLGLYVNGSMIASSRYELGQKDDGATSIMGTSDGQTANFSHSLKGFTVMYTGFLTLEPGTTVTVVAWVSRPIWAEYDDSVAAHTCELPTSATTLPSQMIPGSGAMSPHTLAVTVEGIKP